MVLGAGAATGYSTTLYTPGPPQRGHLALLGATVLAGDHLEAIATATVLIRDGRIVAVGPGPLVHVPAGARVLRVDGLTVIPGLIDLHVHFGSPDLDARTQPGLTTIPRFILDELRYAPGHRRAALAHGITAVRSLGDDHEWIMQLRRRIRDGSLELEGPRVFAAGPLFTAPGGHPITTFGVDPASGVVRVPSDPGQARRMVAALAGPDDPVDVIKVVQDRGGPGRALEPIAPATLNALVAEAHAHGLRVTAHWGTFGIFGNCSTPVSTGWSTSMPASCSTAGGRAFPRSSSGGASR